MKPIVNPWIFYFAEVSNLIKIFCLLGALSLLALLCVLVWQYYDNLDWAEHYNSSDSYFETTRKEYKEQAKKYLNKAQIKKKFIKLCGIGFLITLVLSIVIPTKKTIYEMTIASYITEDNVNAGVEEVKEIVDYVVDKIKE